MTSSDTNCTSSSQENHKLKKFNVPLGIITQGKTCLEKLKTLLKIIDSTTSILIRSSKRWSLAAAISVGIDEKDEIISDEDTLSGSTCTLNGTQIPKKSRNLYHHWHRSIADMRNVAKILAIVSSKCEHSSGCHLCSDYNSNVAAVDAIPCILVSALQTYHRLTVDVNHFLAASSNQASHLSKNPTFSNLSGIEQEVRIITSRNKEITTRPNSQVFHGNSYSQPYRFGGRVGLFGHYLRSLKIILLLTSIKLDASRKKFNQKVVDQILRGICDLASGIEAVERKYVKKGQRLLFCGPDLLQLAAKCIDLQHAFDALLQGAEENCGVSAGCWFACFQENMTILTSMLRRFEAKQVQVLLQYKVSASFQTNSRDRKAASCDFKYFCEDIEPVSLIWTKVDEAMLSSTSDDSHDSFEDSDINDLEDLDEMSTIEVMSHCNPCPSSSSSSSQQKSCSFGSFNQRKDDLELTQPLSKMKQTDEISIPLSESYC